MTVDTLRRLVNDAERFDIAADLFHVVDMARLDTADPEEHAWYWAGYLPAQHVTMLGGHGGAGKSTFGLHLGACVAMGAEAFGRATMRTRVLYFTGEDPASMVLRRLRRICRRLGFAFAEVRQWLQIVDATELEPAMFCERRVDSMRQGATTETYAALAAYIKRESFGLVIVDNASDVFDADEINRPMVRAFVRSLSQMVRGHGGAVLLLAHVDKLTSRAGKQANTEAYSGSTAWHNSVRSRLFLLETGPGELELQHQKCNLGPKQQPLRLEWPHDDVMQVVEPVSGTLAAIEARNDVRSLLKLIHEFYGRSEWVATGITSPKNASRLLSGERGFPKNLKPAEVFGLMRNAERANFVVREVYKDANRKPHERWALTPHGYELLGVAPVAPVAPATQDGTDGAEGAPAAPPSVRGVRGVARAHKPARKSDVSLSPSAPLASS